MSPENSSPRTRARGPAGSSEVQVLVRAIGILRALGDAPGELTLAQIADRVELPRSTVHRIVRTLRDANFVVLGDGNEGVRLGPELARLASVSRVELAPIVRPFLERLSAELDAGVSLAVLEGLNIRFLDQAIVGGGIRAVSVVGAAFPAYSTASGKVLLAQLSDVQLAALLPVTFERLTPNTIVTRDELLAELEEVRETGFGIDREEHELGVRAISRVVRDGAGNCAAITVPMPTASFDSREVEIAQVLRESTDLIDRALTRDPAAV
jgi:DNA-binding IclR family transcriptional regulator